MGFKDGLVGFFYTKFNTLGSLLLKVFPGIASKLDAAIIRIHPEAYASMVAGLTLIATLVCVPLSVLLYFFTGNLLSLVILAVPLIVMLLGVFYPYSQASSISSVFESEVPYAATYLAVMATGGVPPYMSLKRLSKSELMPNLAKVASVANIKVEATGEDPVSAIEDMVKSVKSKDFKDLLLGYVSTLRSGGDVVHFLIRKTEMVFQNRTANMKIIGERLGMLMEAYAATVMMLALAIYIIFIISRGLPSEYFSFPAEQFVVLSYLVMPLMAGMFIYLADITQPKYPLMDKRPYRTFLAWLPLGIAFFILFVTPFYVDTLRYITPFNFTADLIVKLRMLMGLERGYESTIAMCLGFLVLFAPGAIAWERYGKENISILRGMTRFLRDLTETRKTGMSPEKCIRLLSDRNYSGFTKHLKLMSRQIGWGASLKKVYKDFERRVHGWLAKAGMFILIDSIDVGGGAPEVLDTLTTFMEDLEEMEREKRATLRPLMLVPYMTAMMLIVLIVILIMFMRNLLQIARIYISLSEFVHMFLPPVVIIAIISGLVAGKISDGTVAAGFKHAMIMAAMTLISVWLSGIFSVQIITIPT
ncbi:MAG: type II secretion system F family protein [Thaumarchaeota archaeon]|jgi:flagellar protein FlaJ|nr:type II secretion system F family protein [Candidatus Terraquivivens yellowstonensis]